MRITGDMPVDVLMHADDEVEVEQDELTHWGIPGMKWGVRRYQNKDGSLTPRGQKRYNDEMTKLRNEAKAIKNRQATQKKMDRLEAKRKSVEDLKNAEKNAKKAEKEAKKAEKAEKAKVQKPERKSTKNMTDEELANAINRAHLEDAYNQLRPEPVSLKKTIMNKAINEALIPAVTNVGRKAAETAFNKLLEKAIGTKVDPDSLEALTAVRDKLKLKSEIEEYKIGSKINWDNMLKKQTYDDNVRNAAEAKKKAEADAKAAKAKADADAKAKKLQSQRDMMKRNANGRYQVVDRLLQPRDNQPSSAPSINSHLTKSSINPPSNVTRNSIVQSKIFKPVLTKPISSVPQPTVSTGRTAVDDYLLSIGVRRVDV